MIVFHYNMVIINSVHIFLSLVIGTDEFGHPRDVVIFSNILHREGEYPGKMVVYRILGLPQ